MKKIKKLDKKVAQSVVSFACPCLDGACEPIHCGCANLGVTDALFYENVHSTPAQFNTQTINYN